MKTLLLAFVIFVQAQLNAQLIVTKVDRSIDLTSQLVKVSSQVTIKNSGSGSTNDVLIAIEEQQLQYLSYFEVAVSVFPFSL